MREARRKCGRGVVGLRVIGGTANDYSNDNFLPGGGVVNHDGAMASHKNAINSEKEFVINHELFKWLY